MKLKYEKLYDVGETRFNGSGLGSMLDLLFFCNVRDSIIVFLVGKVMAIILIHINSSW